MKNVSRELFEQYYVFENKSREETAKLLGIQLYEVSMLATVFGLKKLKGSAILEYLKTKYPLRLLKETYDSLGYGGVIRELGIKSGDLDKLIKEYQIGKRCRQARIEASINSEELRKFYIEENHSLLETAEHFNCMGAQLRPLLNRLGIVKDRKQVIEVTRRSCLKKYGVESPNQDQEVKNKKRQTSLERYGVENPTQRFEYRKQIAERLNTPEIIEKRTESLRNRTDEQKRDAVNKGKATKVEKYGVDFQNQFESKSKATLFEKYGVPYSVPGHEKMKQTNLKKYGVEQYRQSEECKQHSRKVQYERYGGFFNPVKATKTKEEWYGDPNYNNRDKAKNTMM